MGEHSNIGWTDHTFNPWWGCTNVSPGCDHCYAQSLAKVYAPGNWGKDAGRRLLSAKHWKEPLRWNRRAAARGVRERVFCGSMCDILDTWPREIDSRTLDGERRRLWSLIEETPSLDWQLVTKRPQNFRRMLPAHWLESPRPNIWLMTTVESADCLWRVDELLCVPAVVHGVSYEPGLGPVRFAPYLGPDRVNWLIVGGESGRGHRPMDLEWVRLALEDCCRAGVAFFMKQLGGCPDKHDRVEDFPVDLRVQEFPAVDRLCPENTKGGTELWEPDFLLDRSAASTIKCSNTTTAATPNSR